MVTLPVTKQIELRLADEVLHLTLNRPEARNALTEQMVSEISDAFDGLDDAGVRVVVLRGSGGNFCAGGDVKDMSSLRTQSEDGDLKFIARYSASAGQLLREVNDARQAVVAVLEGSVLGGGLGLACVADVTIALRNARFGLPETSLGLVPAQIAPFIRRRLGESYARLLAVQGGSFDAIWAQRLGIAHYLVDDEDELEAKLTEVLDQINACAPQALTCAKRLMSDSASAEGNDPESLGLIFAQSMLGEEGKEGTAAFMEKRKPRWNRR